MKSLIFYKHLNIPLFWDHLQYKTIIFLAEWVVWMQEQLHVHVSRVQKLNLVSDGNLLIYLPMHVIFLHL